MLARTEVIRAFHLAAIQEYRNWGLADVYVQAEWQTAEDGRVCPKCAELQGKIFTLDEIEPLIPLHPYCRCIALPYIEDIIKYLK
jgi:SPP1 gp7 family putative phage head morphogenesis protein